MPGLTGLWVVTEQDAEISLVKVLQLFGELKVSVFEFKCVCVCLTAC